MITPAMLATATPAAPAVRVEGSLAVIDFDRFDLAAYETFLRAKTLPEKQVTYDWQTDTYTLTTPARFADRLGADIPRLAASARPLASHLFDYQAWIVGMALDAERFAVWADTGLGKTPMLLEWCRQVRDRTGARVLIFQPLGIHRQTLDMAEVFYGQELLIDRIDTRDDLIAWCTAPGSAIGLVNYEKMIPGLVPELRHLGGIALDESSILKTGGGKIKWHLIKSSTGIQFKLSLTATPAPNEIMEYASQASFLERMRSEDEIIWTWFTKTKDGTWEVKPHARGDFYRFMASWSIYLRDPARFGFRDILASLPTPEIHEHRLDITPEQRARMELLRPTAERETFGLFPDERLDVKQRAKLAQVARGFQYVKSGKGRRVERVPSLKPSFAAYLVRREVALGRPTIVWTVFDEEAVILKEQLGDLRGAQLDGSVTESKRADVVDRFRAGDLDYVIAKAQVAGYGLNLQFVRAMVFYGSDDSFERMYQAIRRAYRYGQTETVHIHVPYVPELEGLVITNVKRKQDQFNRDTAIQERLYREALRSVDQGDAA